MAPTLIAAGRFTFGRAPRRVPNLDEYHTSVMYEWKQFVLSRSMWNNPTGPKIDDANMQTQEMKHHLSFAARYHPPPMEKYFAGPRTSQLGALPPLLKDAPLLHTDTNWPRVPATKASRKPSALIYPPFCQEKSGRNNSSLPQSTTERTFAT